MPNKILTYLKSSNGLLILILLVGAILRFWNYFNMPFTYDEMSALLRTNFTNFDDLIDKGVKIDTHPPGVQVFMYYWTQLFGQKEWVVKLPFTLMGLASIYLTFLIAKDWFNETVGLISCSLISVMQFTVMYSQIARPYISGMFLVLCMVYFWNKVIQQPEKSFWKNWSFTILFATLCAYNHHFTLLTVGLIGLIGLFLIDKRYLLKYLAIAPVITLLYLPNVGIFLHQLNRGGVGEWLGPPKPDFLIDFIKYSIHYSYFFGGTLIALVLYGLSTFKKNDFKLKDWIASGALFSLVFLIGYFYSLYWNPVLQFSMLLFVFPFFIFFLFGWISKLNLTQNTFIVALLLLIGTSSLIIERDHYHTFYQNRYFQMKADAMELVNEDTKIVFINYEEIAAHPFPEDFDIDYFIWDNKYKSLQDFDTTIKVLTQPYLMLGYLEQMPKELIGIAFNYYPYVIEQRCYSGATTYLLSKQKSPSNKQLIYHKSSYLDRTIENYMNFKEEDVTPLNGFYLDSSEWSLGMEVSLTDLVEHRYDIINLKATIDLKDSTQLVALVASANNGKEDLLWRASDTKTFTPDENGKVTLYLTIDYNNITFNLDEKIKLNAFLWNQDKQPIVVNDLSLEIIKGNRNKYAIFEKIR